VKITDPTSLLIAARIRRYRTETLNLTLTDLANRMPEGSAQLSGALIGRIENCTRAASLPEVNALARALEVDPSWLMGPGTVCETCGQETTR
jgi:transcriptional regulator with XRE-family HTH domain